MMSFRWAAILARTGLVALLVVLVMPGPVAAVDEPVVLQPAMADLTISEEVTPPVYLKANTGWVSNFALVFDLAGVTGVATARFGGQCTTQATMATCRFTGAGLENSLSTWRSLFSIAPAEGASPGSHGTIMISATGDNAIAGSHRVEVTIETPGFWLGMVYPGDSRVVQTTARAGDLVELPVRIQVGARAINGAAMVVDLSPLLVRADNFSNCRYLSTGPLMCTFDTVLQPHTIYELATTIKLRVDPAFREVFGQRTLVRVWLLTAAQYTHLRDLRTLLGQPFGQPGHGSRLTLRPVDLSGTNGSTSTTNSSVNASPAANDSAAETARSDSRMASDWLGLLHVGDTWLGLGVTVFARHAANFSARVATATVDPTGRIHIRVGIANNGPATAHVPGGNANGARIRVPGRIIFDSAPPDCQHTPEQPPPLPGQPRPPEDNYFWCPTGALLRAGHTMWLDFTGTLLWPYPGSITVNEPAPGHWHIDPNPDDDHANITLAQTQPFTATRQPT